MVKRSAFQAEDMGSNPFAYKKMLNSLHKVLSIIKNGQKNNLLVVTCKETKIAIQVLNVLQENGFILGYRYKKEKMEQNRKTKAEIEILLKYNKEKPVIKSCVLISKPSKKIYKSIKELQSMQETQSIKSNKKGTKRKISLQEPFANREGSIKNPKDENDVLTGTKSYEGEKN